MNIPFHRASLGDEEIQEVTATLKSGWLTTGPRTKQFEADFAAFTGASHAVALNSATAALHLALEAVGVTRGDAVLVPTMTFAATAEVVRYFDAKPILVDCREDDLNIDVTHAQAVADAAVDAGERLKAVIPVHYGGKVCDMKGIVALAKRHKLTIIEDAAHCCPAEYRDAPGQPWKKVGAESTVACYSFYANKCITTGEGGMACTNDEEIAGRMRTMALHGISKDAWKRFTSEGSWYYEIVAPGFKYNLTDIAAALGLHQLKKAGQFRERREAVVRRYRERLSDSRFIKVPADDPDRVHSWHLFEIQLKLDRLRVDHGPVIAELKKAGVGCSVHWMPLHMHPYYRKTYGTKPEDLPVSARVFPGLISLPLYPSMTEAETDYVCSTLERICAAHAR